MEHPTLPFLRNYLKAIVGYPAQVRITARNGAALTLIEVSCRYSDFGRIIGRGGDTYGALNAICKQIGQTAGLPIELNMLKPDNGIRETHPNKGHNDNYDPSAAFELLGYVLDNTVRKYRASIVQGQGSCYFEIMMLEGEMPPVLEQALNHAFHKYGVATGHLALWVRVNHHKQK